ncbi:acyl-CoA dehydrogenase family member 11-like [Dendronephthya gigantea]|uniref:acyl-CoA dehydrogenase family member 11-like n=1 Tax=Dendronephthya gigantea TaxID=151771 RepID=UPI00106AA836|nr:acyl-CoA dehydrogenase family member 11-like [Dendronephthya gigantea]
MFSSSLSALRQQIYRGSIYRSRNKLIICVLNIKRQFKSHNTVLQVSSEFQHSKSGSFHQNAPTLENQYLGDVFLKASLKRILPSEVFNDVSKDLKRFGERVAGEIYELGYHAELNQPILQHYDAWGRRVDEIKTSQEWKNLKAISAEEGLISIGYENKHHEWSRLHQISKLYLFSPSSGLYSCPLAMTDGAAKILKDAPVSEKVLKNAYKHLTSRDPKEFWTSGQWMTERKGGSDVGGGTETIAQAQEDGTYKLYGYKWFSSATDAEMTLTLARICDSQGCTEAGSKGLSLFYLETRDIKGGLNGIQIQRLKNKLGTRQLPTAELLLDGSSSLKISDYGKGVSSISQMLTMTRIHNSLFSVAPMRRILSFARDYATKRVAFQKYLIQHPLHMRTLATMEVETRAGLSLVLEIARLLGLQENGKASENDELVLRLLTSITKLYTAKQAVQVVSEGLECFGGQGYIEDTGLPGLLRDVQVLPIWEGTTNILSLDVLRAITKSKGMVINAFCDIVMKKISDARAQSRGNLSGVCDIVEKNLRKTVEFLQEAAEERPEYLEIAARDLAYSLARVYAGALLTEHASWSEADEYDVAVAKRWCLQDLSPVSHCHVSDGYSSGETSVDYEITMKGHPQYE